MSLSEAVSDYCTSQHFTLLEDGLKPDADQLLSQWASGLGDDLDYDTLAASVNAIAGLAIDTDIKRRFPDLLDAFFDYLQTTGAYPAAGLWQDHLAEIALDYESAIRDDGSVRGKTVTRALKVGRNAPCPCGSGKKYKRCCG